MAKVQKISDLSPNIPFTEFNFYYFYNKSFDNSKLGRIKKLLPLHEMAVKLGLVRESKGPRAGRKSFFTPEGKVALMFLKMYTQLSFPKLLEELNSNIHYQIFCDIAIDPLHPLTNYKLLDHIANEIANNLRIQQQQDLLAETWKPYMHDLDTIYTDATCYESEMRYPTDTKLLWEGIEKSYGITCKLCSGLGLRLPRTKYNDVEGAYLVYRKQRRHSNSQTRKITRRLVNLLDKILKEVRRIKREHADADDLLGAMEERDLEIITRMFRQQKKHFLKGSNRDRIPDRIVSISKPYVRPIVRGKERKNVEFGAKCNNILVDGISFIEKISFNAFNEGSRLKHCISLYKRLFGVDVTKIGGDSGYADSENRNWCKDHHIITSFAKRGRPAGKKTDKDFVRQELARVRATSMEGSFGTQKEHYALRRVKARKRKTEIMYIFFGIHTANVVQLAGKIAEEEKIKSA